MRIMKAQNKKLQNKDKNKMNNRKKPTMIAKPRKKLMKLLKQLKLCTI